jgi:hypothetical protein
MSYIGNNLQSGRSEVFHFTASGGESAITTSSDGRNLLYTVGWCSVYLNGVRLHESDFTATTGNSITGLSPALSANDVVIVEAAHTFSVDSSVPATGGTFSGAVTVPTPTATGHATTKAYVDSAATTATTAAQGVGTGDSPTFAGITLAGNPFVTKQYIGATSGADFVLSSDRANLVIHRAVAVPYQTSDGAWRFRFNFRTSSDAYTAHTYTVSGIMFKNVSNYYPAITVMGVGSSPYLASGQAYPGAATLLLYCASSSSSLLFSGDVELNAKPTWAD